MYNDDVVKLFNMTPVGTKVTVVRQPVKVGWVGNMLYIEAHPDGTIADRVEDMGAQGVDYRVPDDLFARLNAAAGPKNADKIDWKIVREVLKQRLGYPIPILVGAERDFVPPPTRPRREAVPVHEAKVPEKPAPESRPSSIRKKMGSLNG